jgi:uncharacterized protein YcaQ
MTRVSQARKAERLNYARRLLQRIDNLPDAVEQMARECSISPRQAYRYLEHAGRLKGPVSVGEEKIAFTVKLPRGLVQQVRTYARAKRLSLSELVSRALRALLARR